VFGLGTSEILVILAIGAFVLGPDALKSAAKEAGKAASDLKDVPDAFQAGMDEGKGKAKETEGKTEAKQAKEAKELPEKADKKATEKS